MSRTSKKFKGKEVKKTRHESFGVESKLSLVTKFEGYYFAVMDGRVSEFELKMFKAIERRLVELGYKFTIRKKPLFYQAPLEQ